MLAILVLLLSFLHTAYGTAACANATYQLTNYGYQYVYYNFTCPDYCCGSSTYSAYCCSDCSLSNNGFTICPWLIAVIVVAVVVFLCILIIPIVVCCCCAANRVAVATAGGYATTYTTGYTTGVAVVPTVAYPAAVAYPTATAVAYPTTTVAAYPTAMPQQPPAYSAYPTGQPAAKS